jgi:hypothetical protein
MEGLPAVRGTKALARLPLALASGLVLVFIPTMALSPEGALNWWLEVGPGVSEQGHLLSGGQLGNRAIVAIAQRRNARPLAERP